MIVPRSATMPSASDLDLCHESLERVLQLRSDLLPPLLDLIDRVSGLDAKAAIPWLAEHEPRAFAALMQLIAGAYYSHPVVWKLLRYPGQQPVPFP